MKRATTIPEQIKLLTSRGVKINDNAKAEENLLDIGYYRLGFYFFPFEKSYPNIKNRTHDVRENTCFEDAVTLYYFDYDLRNTLSKYISRIEVAFRTYLTYKLSNKYKGDTCWFVNPSVVEQSFINDFSDKCYKEVKRNNNIKQHHKKYKHDTYAPAWKTLEHMTLGSVLLLYKSLIKTDDRLLVAKHFGVSQTSIFENYIEAVRCVRNVCAHSAVLYDVPLHQLVKKGPAGKVAQDEAYSLCGAIKVIAYLIGTISLNRQHDFVLELNRAYTTLKNKSIYLTQTVEQITHMKWELSDIALLESKK